MITARMVSASNTTMTNAVTAMDNGMAINWLKSVFMPGLRSRRRVGWATKNDTRLIPPPAHPVTRTSVLDQDGSVPRRSAVIPLTVAEPDVIVRDRFRCIRRPREAPRVDATLPGLPVPSPVRHIN